MVEDSNCEENVINVLIQNSCYLLILESERAAPAVHSKCNTIVFYRDKVENLLGVLAPEQ